MRSTTVALACAAAAALDGDSEFVARPAIAGPGATGAVLDRLLLGPLDPQRAGGPTDPGSAFREVLAHPPDQWAWEWATSAGRTEKALLSGVVSRRIAGMARLLQPWPPPEVTQAGRRLPWTHPGRPLRLYGSGEITLGKRDGTHTVVAVLTGDHTGVTATASRTRPSSRCSRSVGSRRWCAACSPTPAATGRCTSTTTCWPPG